MLMSFGLRLAPHHRVFGAFAIYSFGLGNIFPRLPDIKAAMGVQEGALGLGLIGTPVGTLIALTFATPLLERIGFRRAVLLTIPLMTVGFAIAAQAPDPLSFFLLLVPVGLMIGSTEVILNVEADRVEHLVGFRIMNRAHSFWSIGFFGAGLFGAAVAQLGLSTGLHLALVVPLTTIGVALILGGYQPAAKRAAEAADHAAPRFARPTGAILVLVAVTLSAMLMEGASLDWSAIYMRNVFDSGPFLSGFAVATFAFCQAASRFFADSFVDRHSPSGVARALLCVMALGVFCAFISDWPALSLLGFALIGVGCSAIFPLAVSAAAQRHDRAATINVAALAQISFIVFLVGPPLLGSVAEHWGIRWAFGLGMPLIGLSLLLAGALGSKPIPASIEDEPEGEPLEAAPAERSTS
jgi:MFS family permease